MELEKYFLVTLRRPAEHPDLSADEVAELQIGHLAFHDRLRRQGVLAFNGPVRDGPDATLRGLACYRTATAEQALEHAQGDPMVSAGWLAAEAMEFWTQPGAIARPGIPFTV
jgi:uncharacterized protein YciI